MADHTPLVQVLHYGLLYGLVVPWEADRIQAVGVAFREEAPDLAEAVLVDSVVAALEVGVPEVVGRRIIS